MANATFNKSLILLVFFLVLSLAAFSQKKQLKQFSNEFSIYLSELDGFMTTTNNDELRSVYKNFLKKSRTLSEVEKINVIQISNRMLSIKRVEPAKTARQAICLGKSDQ